MKKRTVTREEHKGLGAMTEADWQWEPRVKATCVCGHSWRFHWLQAPHCCNDCASCTGYQPAAGEERSR